MAPNWARSAVGTREIERGAAGRKRACRSAVVLLIDVLDNLGHIILVLAELRGILEHLFVLFPVLFLLAACILAASLAFAGLRSRGLSSRFGLLFGDRNLGHRFAFLVGLGGQIGLEFLLQRRDILDHRRRGGAGLLVFTSGQQPQPPPPPPPHHRTPPRGR